MAKMMHLKTNLFLLAVVIFGCIFYMDSVNGMTHVVGGSHGWRVPDNKTFFEEWSKPRTFGVGDRLSKLINVFGPISLVRLIV